MLMIDGKRVLTSTAICLVDPSIIPQLAVDRIDVLADGASATYGADAVAGVINIILKRGYDGAISQFRVGQSTSYGGLLGNGGLNSSARSGTAAMSVTYEYYQHIKGARTREPILHLRLFALGAGQQNTDHQRQSRYRVCGQTNSTGGHAGRIRCQHRDDLQQLLLDSERTKWQGADMGPDSGQSGRWERI